jgi:hypothetical protein
VVGADAELTALAPPRCARPRRPGRRPAELPAPRPHLCELGLAPILAFQLPGFLEFPIPPGVSEAVHWQALQVEPNDSCVIRSSGALTTKVL